MKYNSDVCTVECDAYELCALTQRNGSLGAYTPQRIPIEFADGDMYYRIQSEAHNEKAKECESCNKAYE